MYTKTLGRLAEARDGKNLGSDWDPLNTLRTLFQLDPFQTFAWNTSISPGVLSVQVIFFNKFNLMEDLHLTAL